MIAVAVTDYDDENIVDDCEAGWKRFCIETLVRTHYHLKSLCADHRRLGRFGMQPTSRKAWEILRRQIAAYRWVFDGTGGLFTFEQTCRDLGLDPRLVRAKVVSQCRPRRDINLLVEWVVRQEDRRDAKRRREDSDAGGVGTSIVAAVRDFRRRYGSREGRRGAQTHAVCRDKNRQPD